MHRSFPKEKGSTGIVQEIQAKRYENTVLLGNGEWFREVGCGKLGAAVVGNGFERRVD